MKDPRNNKNKWLRPDEPFSIEELMAAHERLLFREAMAGREAELQKAIDEYMWSTGR